MQLTKQITILAPLEAVYNAYADIKGWKNVLDDVVDVQVNYDDGNHQEFDMTVQRGASQETVHSVRFCYPYSSIELFQTIPPPGFRSMRGVWKFNSQGQGTFVQATREFEIKDGVRFDSSILEKFLEKNLLSFKQWVEANAQSKC